MKKFLMALAATTLVASPLITTQVQAAPQRETTRIVKEGPRGRTVVQQRTVVRQNNGYRASNRYRANTQHRWAKGQRFDRRHATNYRVINDYRSQRLSAPPRGYQWVQSGNDAVMIALASGIIGAVVGGAIR